MTGQVAVNVNHRLTEMLIPAYGKNTLAVTTFNIDNNGSKVKGMDVRPLVGLGYTIPNTGLDINARYYIGTSDLSSSFKSKMNSFEVSLAWLFNASRF